MNAPIRSTANLNANEVIATACNMQEVVDIFRTMKARWGLTNEFCDSVGGLTDGHTDKCLGPSEDKRLGYDTFALFCELFAVEFHAKINMDAVERMEAVWEKRKRMPELSHTNRISKKLVERAKPLVFKAAASNGGIKRAANLPAKLRTEIARKAGKASGRARRRAKRLRALNKGSAPQLDKPGLPRPIDAHLA